VTTIYRINGSGWGMMLHHAALTATPAHHGTAAEKATNDFSVH
jgi:hypothetical protein